MKGVGEMANLLSLRHIFKIPSSELVAQNWNATLDINEAIEREMMISVASSYLIRAIDDIKKSNFNEESVSELKKEIKRLTRQKSSADNKRKIAKMRQKLEKMLFIPDYINVVIESNKHYERANKGFTINGIKFKRLLATSGGVKLSTIIYVNEEIYDKLMERINCGRDMEKLFVPAKLESYMGLVCSASNPVFNTHKILVVHDAETNFLANVIELDDSYEPYPKMEYKENYPISNNASDGFGLIMPHMSQQWANDLHLDYLPSGFTTRHAFCKGMLFTFDFVEFAREVANNYMIKDVWGKEHDIRDIDIVLTTSMLKLWDSYNSLEHYLSNCDKYKYTFSVTKYTPKVLDNERNLNYQFIQSLKLDDEDIKALAKPTIDEIKEVLGGDYRKAILYLRGINMNEEYTTLDSYDYINALMVEPELANDPYVRSSIYGMLQKRIDDAKIGVLKVNGNFQILSGDPYLLCESMFGLEPKGLLEAGGFYSNYWNERGVKQVAAFRAPMICMNNIRLFNLKRNEQMDKWFKYMNNVVIVNAWDTSPQAMMGFDFDGDTTFTTDNPIIIKGVEEQPAIISLQKSATKLLCNENHFIQSNKMSFGSEIGSITIRSTSMFDVLAQYEEGSPEYEELMYRIKCSIQYQQNSIDLKVAYDCEIIWKNLVNLEI